MTVINGFATWNVVLDDVRHHSRSPTNLNQIGVSMITGKLTSNNLLSSPTLPNR